METPIIPEQLAPFIPLAQGIVTAIAVLVIGWMASKWAHRMSIGGLRSRGVDESLVRFLANMAQYTVLAAAVVSALGAVGIETASVIALLASAGLAVGLALQGNLANFASGVMILFFRPFTLADMVTVAGQTGVVEDIGLFATTLITADNKTIIVPNAQATGGVITNITRRGSLRGEVDVGVAYGSNLQHVEQVLLTAAGSAQTVLQDPAPAIAFTGMGASSLDFKVLVWSDSGDYLAMLHDVRHRVYRALEDAGIDIPYNQIVVRYPPESNPMPPSS